MQTNRLPRLVYLVLIFVTLVVFHQLPSHDFINLDDDILVYENPHVHAGITKEGIAWAFTTFEAYNYHPLTWLSHMLDCELFGLRPGMHHLTNLLFHLMNTALLLFVLRKMTGALWRSVFVAALFALHPLHVESVAWVAERKDLLSAFFWFLSIWAYARYAERPGLNRYLPVLLFFSLGLLAKPMVVTLPFVLLLLDFWPLGRTQFHQAGPDNRPLQQKVSVFRLVWEKIPLFALAAVFIAVTFAAQQQGGALKSLEAFPLTTRIANALISYLSYIGKMIWPDNLAVYYPHSGSIPLWQAASAGLALICMTVLVIWTARKGPYLAVGWLWYLGTLVPVIGLVQVGSQAMADRYTYLPLVGLFIALAWGVPSLFAGWRHRQSMLAILATIVLVSFTVCTWLQLRHWQNSITLFQHTLRVTTNNHFAHNNLGVALAHNGRLNEAISHYSEALRLKPEAFEVHNNLANALAAQGNVEEAIQHYSAALRLEPGYDKAHNNLGNALAGTGRGEEAIIHYSEAIKINPDYAGAHYNLANALAAQGSVDEAVKHYFEALRLEPDYDKAHNNLGNVLAGTGRGEEAIIHYSEAIKINPDYAGAHYNLANALAAQGSVDEAIQHYFEALRILPDWAGAHNNLGVSLEKSGKLKEAIDHYHEALRIRPDYAKARNNLERALRLMGESAGGSNPVSKLPRGKV